ncbi:nucleolar protein 6 [Sitophilus oryzae]|uniref:Nucleolar protein 6 n=1 Tax=Sitophilus oryzae TaxID=7048 RepID=A0A6J2XYW0_SITOR|nr:nucleolar protein 6 [Sitophilus oryzae]
MVLIDKLTEMDSWDEDSDENDLSIEEPDTTGKSIVKLSTPKQSKRKNSDSNNTKLKKVKYESISQDIPKKNKNKDDMYKPPTVEELNNLKETENLYNNNLFRLQIAELVKEISIKSKRRKSLNSWLRTVNEELENLPEFKELSLSDIKPSKKKSSKRDIFINNIASKYSCNIKTDQNLVLKFSKPTNIQSFGLKECNSYPGPNIEASINIKMPKLYLNVKDFLNNRYLVKRFYYLIYLAEHITGVRKQLCYHENNILLPVLEMQPTKDEKLKVKIYVTPPEGYFKPSRFLPNMNNVRINLFDKSRIEDITVLKNTPTILYNSAIAHDVTLSTYSEFVKTVLHEHYNVQEGIKLLCVWLKQRELNIGYGAFTENLVLYIIIYLLVKKKLNKLMSSYQVVRNFWSFVSSTDLSKNPLSLGNCDKQTLELFKQSFSIVFLDCTGSFNAAAFLNEDIMKKVSAECEMALKHLDNPRTDSFHSLFLTKLSFNLQYDVIINITESLPLKECLIIDDSDRAKYVGYGTLQNIGSLIKVIKRGLNKRILHIVPRIEVQLSEENTYPIKKVLLGINLNSETAFNFIEKGPSLSDHSEAEKFRQFWGYLFSDRRFRDGSAHVAVYFKTNTIRAKRNIIKQILQFLLTEKLQLKFRLYYNELEDFLINKKIKAPYPVGTNEEGCLKVINLSDELGQKIRGLQMSLSITGILGLSDTFCYCNVYPPIARDNDYKSKNCKVQENSIIFNTENVDEIPQYVQANQLVLYLEHSSKWPNNLEGVRHIKTTFLLEISKKLSEIYNIKSRVTKNHLDVFYEGLIFRYILYVPKEVALMKKATSDSGVVKYVESQNTLNIERDLNILPKIIGALKGLQLQFPSFGSGTALIKKWLRCQLIDEFHISDITINLLNASLFLHNSTYSESCTPQISFLRFLKFISEFQWELQPLVVNFNDELSKEDLADLESKFQQHSDTIQPLYIITPYDQGASLFTKESPTREILIRIRQLANITLNLMSESVIEQKFFDLTGFFSPNMDGYNLIIHLNPQFNSRRHENTSDLNEQQVILEKYVKRDIENIPFVEFSPVDEYLKELRNNYRGIATFFHNIYGGNCIGVLWNPPALETKEFKVNYVNGRKLVDDKLVLNIEAITEDLYILGKDLVKWIERTK